ncbi:PD-(D/E)XK nuclease family protein [Flavobacterium yafengii]|uniref:PDDEXK-like family protein n=1 Tax=Flavobacterium yafengii TaxID=3041253 RepID=UPI0024A9E373|nr:PD-(D/E)XK nuclease family protein [Flavobacterium yafengii]MDI6047791.1 PD-(D/E)XK nuclease family protein [Flavobacterium yafengii]
MNTEKAKNLLTQVGGLLKSYEKLAKSTGENFNIFSVMGMESDEVKTHSAIIGELLNPKGSHGLGDKPLRLFIKLIVEPLYKDIDEEFVSKFSFNFENTRSYVEDFAGKINEEATEGGRIDIVIKDNKNKVFLIENKIYAGEQKNQLIRYKNFYPNAPILFLTLYGKDAESAQNLEKNKDYFTISYELDIILWLAECVKEAVKFPMLREVIYQYINLIKKLTHQTMNHELEIDIKNLIKNNFSESLEIKNNFDQAKNEVISEFWKELANSVQSDLKTFDKNWTVKVDNAKLISRFNHILLFNEANEDAYLYCRYNKNDGEITYGIILNQKFITIKGTDVLKEVSPNSKFKSGPQSVIWEKEKDENYNFGESAFLTSLYKNHKKQDVTIVTIFKEKIIEFIEFNQTLYLATLKYLEEPNLIINSNFSENGKIENQSDYLSN